MSDHVLLPGSTKANVGRSYSIVVTGVLTPAVDNMNLELELAAPAAGDLHADE